MNITFRKADIGDVRTVTELSLLLYDYNTFESLFKENQELLNSGTQAIFLALEGKRAVGFAHCSLRSDYVEGTHGGNIGYLEGIYVLPEHRHNGIARSFVSLCEDWAREKGCREFASDCELENTDSYNFHLKVGFNEANRIICFTKELK